MSNDRLRRQHRFTITPEHLILDPRVSDRAFRLWCRLDRYAGENESAYPTRESLAIELNCSPSSIDRATTELVTGGWLRKERRADGDTCLYTLIVAPEREVERLVAQARKERVEQTQPRRDKARERRRESKRANRSKGEVSEGGVVTSDETLNTGGVVTGDETPVVTGDERGVVTGDEQKEASTQGSNRQGEIPPPSTAGAAETGGRSSKAANDLTEQERKTGKTADGKVLPPAKRKALAQEIASAWWDWIEPNGFGKPAQKFVACRGVIETAIGNGRAPKQIKCGLAELTKAGKPVSGGTLTYAMDSPTCSPSAQAGMRRGYDDVATWGNPEDDTDESMSDDEIDALFAKGRTDRPRAAGTHG